MRRTLTCTLGAAGLACAAIVGLVGSSSAASAPHASRKVVRIAYSGFAASNSFSQATYHGIQAVAATEGATTTFLDANFSSEQQFNGIENAVTSGRYDAIIVNANDPSGIAPAVRYAIQHKVKVIALFVPIGPKLTTLRPQVAGLTASIGVTPSQTGTQTADLIVRACGGKPCNVAYLPGSKSLPLETVRTQYALKVLKAHRNIKLVSEQEGGYTSQEGLATTQNLLQAHPNVQVIASSDQAIEGAAIAVRNAGLEGKIKLIGQGASEQAVTAIRSGRWYGAFVYVPYAEGALAAKDAIKAVRGQKLSQTVVNDESLSPIGALATRQTLAKSSFKGDWRS